MKSPTTTVPIWPKSNETYMNAADNAPGGLVSTCVLMNYLMSLIIRACMPQSRVEKCVSNPSFSPTFSAEQQQSILPTLEVDFLINEKSDIYAAWSCSTCRVTTMAIPGEQKPTIMMVTGAWHRPFFYDVLGDALNALGYGWLCPELASSQFPRLAFYHLAHHINGLDIVPSLYA
jgi:hypothetical protein